MGKDFDHKNEFKGGWIGVDFDGTLATYTGWKGATVLGEPLEPRWHRQPIADPEAHIKPYVEFLQEQGTEPHAFMMEAFKRYQLVVMGEVHNRPQYWAFNTELLRDPAFGRSVGTIYLELPSNHQENTPGETGKRHLILTT